MFFLIYQSKDFSLNGKCVTFCTLYDTGGPIVKSMMSGITYPEVKNMSNQATEYYHLTPQSAFLTFMCGH